MKVTLEQIDELRNRVNVSYEEAKKTLEKNDGDLIKSIIELEKVKGKKKESRGVFTRLSNRLLALKFSVKNKDGDTLINIPLVLVLITFMMAFWVVIFGLIIAVGTSCKIKIYRNKNSVNINSLKKNMKDTVEKIKVKTEKIIEEDENNQDNGDSSEDNEIIIE